jgi:hypothetical protein
MRRTALAFMIHGPSQSGPDSPRPSAASPLFSARGSSRSLTPPRARRVPDELEETFFALRADARLLTELNPPAFAADFSTVQDFATRFKYLTARTSELVERLGKALEAER